MSHHMTYLAMCALQKKNLCLKAYKETHAFLAYVGYLLQKVKGDTEGIKKHIIAAEKAS